MKIFKNIVLLTFWAALMSSCSYYKQDIMFKTETSINEAEFTGAIEKAKKGYRLKKGDVVTFTLYTNKGEVIIDPNYDLAKQLGENKDGMGFTKQDGSASKLSYVVDDKGFLLLPMIGKVLVDSISHSQFDSILSVKYAQFYQEPFIVSQISSRHVVLISGLSNKIIPLGQENMNLIEAIASIEKGLDEYSNVKKIRLVRGNLQNPSVMVIDLSTIEGLKKTNLTLLPNDIIYIEPGRNAVRESIRDYLPYISVVTSALSLILIVLNR